MAKKQFKSPTEDDIAYESIDWDDLESLFGKPNSNPSRNGRAEAIKKKIQKDIQNTSNKAKEALSERIVISSPISPLKKSNPPVRNLWKKK